MILQALCTYYDALARRGEITPSGWSNAKVSFALDIDEQGTIQGIFPLKIKTEGSKKEVPQLKQVPEQQKRAVNICANFLCDNSSYFFGTDNKGKPDRTLKCFEAAKTLHQEILASVDSPAARAVYAFFDTWQPQLTSEDPILAPYLEEILKGGNLIFTVDRHFVHEDPAIRAAWQSYRTGRSAGAVSGRCLVTGKQGPVARLHPAIRGIKDTQPSGASLVSFNAPAFESYGHEGKATGQGLNSPVSEEAAFQYGAVLNRLIADREHLQYIGDTAVVYWAEDAESLCQDVFLCAMFGGTSEIITDADVKSAVKALANGRPVDVNGIPLHPDNRFYVLGLAPNAGRISVRFFLQNTFGQMLRNVQEHNERLKIVKPAYVTNGTLSLWRLLNETVNQNSRDKKASPPMAGAVTRAILSNQNYPNSLLEQTMLRIRAEQNVTYGRAAILKAFFLKNRKLKVPEGVLRVELNDQSNHLPYVLGRLFAVLERVQYEANPEINTTIKDKYFNSACATPATIFPLLTKLSQSHLRKLERGLRIYYEKMIGDLEDRIHETLPVQMSLTDQGTFHLGYYHQTQKFYEKKNDKGGSKNV